jgi:tetratricopeptide (TPR) repeat protein
MSARAIRLRILGLLLIGVASPVAAQQGSLAAGLRVASLRAEPSELRIVAGQTLPIRIVALDANGRPVADAQLRIAARRTGDGALSVTPDSVTALSAGRNTITASVVLPPDAGREPATIDVPVIVSWPAISTITVTSAPGRLYAGTRLRHQAVARHADGSERPRAEFEWTTSDPNVATVDRFGNVTAIAPGSVTITARIEGHSGTLRNEVLPFEATMLRLSASAKQVVTGDVVHLEARATTADGRSIDDAPTEFTYTFTPDDSIHAPGAPGLIRGDRFVGEVPGQYILTAWVGNLAARTAIDVRPRQAVRGIVTVGHGAVTDVHTSDLWVFQGVDGRDYAITGTWSADGWAYFWDVTDPSAMVKTDSVHLDARTVNDVKVSPDGRYAALSREGASNRRNGVVLLDLAHPAHPTIVSTYDEGLTGGVHNMFATDDYLFALSAGDKYVILDVRDLAHPKFVSEYNHPDSRIHDVWVYDGLAYSSEWQNGVVIVDVGNGRWGGTIEKPKLVTSIPYPVGRTHAAYPWHQQSTGRTYLFLGDEIIGRGEGAAWRGPPVNSGDKGGTPEVTSGYYHVIDVTDPLDPQDVARYEVKEFGTHNLWIEDDILFAAYYEGGVRMVDVSGELLGNLAEQGREIAVYKSYDPKGFIANAAMVWGAQPYKGHVFFADHYSGLWAVRMLPGPTAPQRPAGTEAVSLLGKPLMPVPVSAAARPRLEANLAAARAAYEHTPENADSIIWLGRRIAYLGRYREAIEVFTRGIALHPDDARLYRHRGHRYISVREFDRAIADLEKAASLVRGRPDEVEPDGAPNAYSIPTSTLQSNIWYHLALARYLKHDFQGALPAWLECMTVSANDDMRVATSDWLYMTYRRLGRPAEAAAVLEPIRADMRILENEAYHKRLLMYKGEITADALLAVDTDDPVQIATYGYGVGNWYLYNGDGAGAQAIFRRILESPNWSAFGYIAAEAELASQNGRAGTLP